MPFNINTIKANLENNGYLKNHSFEVIIAPPPILLGRNINILGTPTNVKSIINNLSFRIEQVRSPGINLALAQVNPFGYGMAQPMPHNATYQDTNFSILVDGYGEIWQFWHNWIRSIFEFSGNDSSRVGAANRLPTYLVEYKENYSTMMQIVVYDTFGNAIQRINLHNAFPSSMRDIQLSWNDTGNLMRLAISISYTEYTIVGSALEGTNPQLLNTRNNSQLNRVVTIS
jgi:hypothetical protein